MNTIGRSGTLNTEFGRLPPVPQQAKGGAKKSKSMKKKLARLRKKKGTEEENKQDFPEPEPENFYGYYADASDEEANAAADEDEGEDHVEEDADDVAKEVVRRASTAAPPAVRRQESKRAYRLFSAACVATGLVTFLASANGGSKDPKYIKQLVQKMLDLLRYTKHALDGTSFSMDDDELVQEAWSTAQAIASTDVTKILEHLEDLRARYRRSPLTLRQYAVLYKVFYGWFFGWFPAGVSGEYSIGAQDRIRLDATLKQLSSHYLKLGKTESRADKQSVEQMVSSRTWPENGFKSLMDALIPHIETILAMDPESIVGNDYDYNYFVRVMICALYAHGVQGRAGGVKSILLSQAEDLFEDGT